MRKGKFKKGAFLVAGMMAVNLGMSGVASAANGWEENLVKVDLTTTMTTQVSATAAISMGSGTTVADLDAANASTNPDEAGKVLSQVATVTVGNTSGFSVYVSGDAALTGRNSSGHKIPSVSSAKTLGSMSNEWGWYGVIGDTEASYNPSTSFKGMSTSQQSVGTGGATTSNVAKKVTLFYGARVNSSVAEDYYGNTVTVSVVAQPGTVTTSRPITMQEMTAERCRGMSRHQTAYLEDERDRVNGVVGTGTHYWITKMFDDNCWMSQNLALDLKTNTPLTTATSATAWTPGQNTQTDVTVGSTSSTGTYSWNLGKYVIINPTVTTACSSNNTGLSACTGQFMAVGSRTPSSDPNFYQNNGNKTYTDKEYDAHYLAGNYYQWNAATAGTGGSITNADASGSICPKNWRLPSSGNNTTKGTFGYMLTQYGVASSLSGTSSVNSNTYNIALSPLFFVRGGYINPNAQRLSNAGQYSDYWSSRAYSNTANAYELYFVGSSVSPSSYTARYNGQSLRCLIPTA